MTRKQTIIALILAIPLLLATRCESSQETRDVMAVIKQQMHFAIKQPIPFFNWSLERSLLIQLYQIRNKQVATHSVLRGDTSVIEFDCPSIGYGMPYDTSLTNPWMATDEAPDGIDKTSLAAIGQAEPNGIFAAPTPLPPGSFVWMRTGK